MSEDMSEEQLNENKGTENENLSDETRAAFEAFLTDEAAIRSSFDDVLRAVTEEAFHYGGDKCGTVVSALLREIGDGVLGQPLSASVEYAIKNAYEQAGSGTDGGGVFDRTKTAELLEKHLSNLTPKDTIKRVFNSLVVTGLESDDETIGAFSREDFEKRVSLENVLNWAGSARVKDILKKHFMRLAEEYVPGIYAECVRNSPVEYITKIIHEKLIGLNEDSEGDVWFYFNNIVSDIRSMISELIEADIVKATGIGKYTFDNFKSHFGHALLEAKELFLESPSVSEPVKSVIRDTRIIIMRGIFSVDFWSSYLSSGWDEAMKRIEEPAEKDAPPQQNSSNGAEKPKRSLIIAQNEARKKELAEARRRNYSGRHPKTRRRRWR